MKRLALLCVLVPAVALAVGEMVVPCGSALCIGGNQQPITLGGTVQVTQGFWPDGGLAILVPVVSGASLALLGTTSDPNDGGNNGTPGVIIGSRNSLSLMDPLVSFKANQAVVARLGSGSVFQRSMDGGAQTQTVPSGSTCVCNDSSDSSKSCKAPVSSTTATISGTTSDTLSVICL